jgi:hypothetical protein
MENGPAMINRRIHENTLASRNFAVYRTQVVQDRRQQRRAERRPEPSDLHLCQTDKEKPSGSRTALRVL